MNANMMAEINVDKMENNRRLAIIGLLAVGIGLLALALLATNASAAHYDWRFSTHTVANTETYTNATIDATNIDIPAGTKLVLINVTLNFTSNGRLNNYGTLEIMDYDGNNATTGDNSVVQRLAGNQPFFFRTYSNGNLSFKNSEINYPGLVSGTWANKGIYIESKNATFIGSIIRAWGDIGVLVYTNAQVSIINCSIYSTSANAFGVYVTDGKLNITGTKLVNNNNWNIRVTGNSGWANIKTIDASGGSGVSADAGAKVDIIDSYIHDNKWYGTYWNGASGHVNNTNISYNTVNGNNLNHIISSTVEFNDCKVYNSLNYGFQISSSSTVTLTNTKVDRSRLSGIWANSGKLIIEKSEFNDNQQYYGIEMNVMTSVRIANSTFDRNPMEGITIASTPNVVIEGNSINSHPNGYAVTVYSCTKVIINNNTLKNNNYGIYVQGSSNLIMNGNTLLKTNTNAIRVQSSTGVMNGNTLRNTTSNTAVYLYNNARLKLDKNLFDNNNNNNLYIEYSYIDITNSTFNGTNGRSIYFYYTYACTLVGNKFTYPRSWDNFVYSDYSQITLIDKNTFDGKTITNGYGARGFYINYQRNNNFRPVITDNIFKNMAGGFYYYDYNGWKDYGIKVSGNKFMDLHESTAMDLHLYYYRGMVELNSNSFSNVQSNCMLYYFAWYNYNNVYISVQNNTFNDTGRAVHISNDGYNWWGHYPYMAFKNNTVNNNHDGYAVYTWMVGPFDVVDSTIKNSYGGFLSDYVRGTVHVVNTNISDNQYWGMRLHDQWQWGIRLYVVNSKFSDNNGEGLYTYHMYYVEVKDSEFNNNNNGLYCDYNYWGLKITGSTLNNNSNHGYYGYQTQERITIEDSHLDGNGNGYYTYYNYYGFDISKTTFNENSGTGMVSYYSYSWNKPSTLTNCEFSNNNQGTYWYETQFIATDCLFANNSYGAQVNGGSGGILKFQDCKFYDNSETGLGEGAYYMSVGSGVYNSEFVNNNVGIEFWSDNTNFYIENNRFSMGSYGIEDWGYGIARIHGNEFKLVGTGIYIEEASADIDDNTFSTIWSSAIYIEWGGSCTITNNEFSTSNTAVYIYSSIVTFEGNTYTGNNVALDLDQSMAFLTKDSFYDGSTGIRVSEMSILTVADITMENFAAYGIECPGMAYMDIQAIGASTIKESPIQMYGDITVMNGGTLTVDNSKIVFFSPGGTPYKVLVQSGGTLELRDAELVAANATRHFGLTALAGSDLTITDTKFMGVGYGTTPEGSGIYIGGQATLEGITIDDAVNGLFISNGVYMTMRNSTIVNTTANDIWIQNASTLRVGNTKFNVDHVTVLDTSMIIIDRIIKVTAVDDANDPYPAVDVTVTQEGVQIAQAKTDADGSWFSFFEGAIISKDGYSETLKNYTVELTDGIQTLNDSFVLTTDYDEIFAFGVAPVVQNGPAQVTTKEDTPLDVDFMKYFLDNDTMTYTVKGAVSLAATFSGDTMTLTPANDWFGTEVLTLVATDTHGLISEFKLTVIVTPVNDMPVVSGVPNLNLFQDNEYVLDLTPYISDPDTPLSSLTITVSTQYGTVKGTTVVFNYPIVTIEYVRISVKDSEGGSAQDILVSVQAGNNPPKLKGLPEYFNATEDIEEEFNLAPYLDNGGANISLVTITSDAKEITKINGTKITVLFPDGQLWRTVPITVANQNGNRTYQVKFYVNPVNDAPVLADLPMVTVTEGIDYVFDLTTFVTDVDTALKMLTVTTNRTDIKVDGMLLIINVKNAGSNVPAAVSVYDGHNSVTKTLRLTVINVNDQPQLSLDIVSRTSGSSNDKFIFTVTLTDPDTDYPTVYVVIDGQRYTMKKTAGSYDTGAVYALTMNLKAGKHTYHFEADDGTGAPNSKAWTADKTNLSVSEPLNYLPILALIIILVVIAIIIMAMRSRSKPVDDIPAEETATEETDEAFKGVEEEEEPEEETQEEDEPEEAEEVEAEPIEEEEPKALKTKASEATTEPVDAENAKVKPRKAKDLNLPKSEDLNKVEPEKPKDATTLSEKDSDAEVKSSDQDLDTLMKDIMKDNKVKKKKSG